MGVDWMPGVAFWVLQQQQQHTKLMMTHADENCERAQNKCKNQNCKMKIGTTMIKD